jgi:hypothetical protein
MLYDSQKARTNTITFQKYTPVGHIEKLDQEQQARQRMNTNSIRYQHPYAIFSRVAG